MNPDTATHRDVIARNTADIAKLNTEIQTSCRTALYRPCQHSRGGICHPRCSSHQPDGVLDGRQAFITDFGFATKEGVQATYRGTLTTASNRVLEILAHDRQALVGSHLQMKKNLWSSFPWTQRFVFINLIIRLTALVLLLNDTSARDTQFWGCCIYLRVLERSVAALDQHGACLCQEWWK